MADRDLSRLNKLVSLVDNYENPETFSVLLGVAISVDDLDSFLADVRDLAVNKYGGATYGELLDIDPDDSVMKASSAQYDKEQVEAMFRAVERIMRDGK